MSQVIWRGEVAGRLKSGGLRAVILAKTGTRGFEPSLSATQSMVQPGHIGDADSMSQRNLCVRYDLLPMSCVARR
jgi:hypothetical protein